MDPSTSPPTMNQAIFTIGLPTEAVSLYLLCCGLADLGLPVSRAHILDKWNDSEASLDGCLAELERRNILQPAGSGPQIDPVYRIMDAADWVGG